MIDEHPGNCNSGPFSVPDILARTNATSVLLTFDDTLHAIVCGAAVRAASPDTFLVLGQNISHHTVHTALRTVRASVFRFPLAASVIHARLIFCSAVSLRGR